MFDNGELEKVTGKIASYRRNQLEGAKPAQILIMLLEAAVQRARTAVLCSDRSKDKERGEAVRKLVDIVIELRSTLDRAAGGEIAANLDALYDYVITTSIEAHAQRDAAKFESVARTLDMLRDGFSGAAKKLEAEAQAAPQQPQLHHTQAPAPAAQTPAPPPPAQVVQLSRAGVHVQPAQQANANTRVAFRRYAAL